MRPSQRDLDDEIKGHLALEIQQRIERGEDPEAARVAALRDFGYVPAVRDEVRRVWYSRFADGVGALVQDMHVALRSLRAAKGLALTVIATLALGIGANAATFSVVRGVLLRPLVNRDEARLVYIRQSAPGVGTENLTFSVPEIRDLRSQITTLAALAEFSTVDFTLLGLGEPRVVQAGVVNGSYFDVMGLRPVLGRLLDVTDDRPDADGAAVLTYRFWTTSLNGDPTVVGKTITLGTRPATVVGVLEPSVPYPVDTEIIANVVTSPHHLGATMVTLRTHRMTELFGRLVPGVTVEDARAEISAAHAAMVSEHPASYSGQGSVQVTVRPLREQIAAPARTILLLLLAAAAVVFVIACSNVANLILARSVRREGELAVRAALGASAGALRRTLLAESLVLCGTGAALGVVLARPLVALFAQFGARFSVRALEVTADASVVWVGMSLAMLAAVLLAYVPKLPSASAPTGLGLASGGVRITPRTNRRLRGFAAAQIAFSFVLLAGAGMLLVTLMAVQASQTGLNLRQVLAVDVPPIALALSDAAEMERYREITRRVRALPGVVDVAVGNFVPWRDAGSFGPGTQFAVEGYTPPDGEDHPRARIRMVSSGFFSVMGVPLLMGRDFTNEDHARNELVVIVSESVARRLFPNGDALNRRMWWTDEYFGAPQPRRIVGIVADVDDENVVQGPALTVYHPVEQMPVAGRLFVHAERDPYTLVAPINQIVRELSPTQPVERAATLEDVRAAVLAPDRLNAFVALGFAGVALLIAAIGVAGVLAFSVSARTREFGIRLAVGSTPWSLLTGVLSEGAAIIAFGISAGAVACYACAVIAGSYVDGVRLPGALPVVGAGAVLAIAAVAASLMPAVRASRIDVVQALRLE